MKKTIKILTAAILAIGFGSLANAQSATITANATVISEIVVETRTNLNFGTVVVGQTKSVSARESILVSSGPTLGTSNRGYFVVRAQQGSNVNLSFLLPSNLSSPIGELLPISFNYGDSEVAYLEDSDYEEIDFYPTSALQINSFNSSDPDGREIKVFIGGQVNATGVPAGSYIGNITLSATYN